MCPELRHDVQSPVHARQSISVHQEGAWPAGECVSLGTGQVLGR
jgi:hypothetical protein